MSPSCYWRSSLSNSHSFFQKNISSRWPSSSLPQHSNHSKDYIMKCLLRIQTTVTPFCCFSSYCSAQIRKSRQHQVSTMIESSSKTTAAAATAAATATTSTTTLFLSNVYPDGSASAAGVRTRFLMEQMAQQQHSVVHYATAAGNDNNNNNNNNNCSPNTIQDELQSKHNNIHFHYLPPNRSNLVTGFLQSIQPPKSSTDPLSSSTSSALDRIVFDRFYIEEAYSFAFYNNKQDNSTPMMVLDMQDMHSLRWGRQQLVQEMDKKHSENPFQCLEEVLEYIPPASDPHLLRELSSIHRNDLTLVCSPYELDLLCNIYHVPAHKLCLASFFVDPTATTIPTFTTQPTMLLQDNDDDNTSEQTPTFVFCGGFRHAPNVDAVRILLRYVWPKIRRQLPTATLHIHGAYCTQEIYQHTSNSEGIVVHGFTPNLADIFSKKGAILLAPLRFGAGIKGKIVDAWTYGMPVVTTPVGSEGMTAATTTETKLFGGRIAMSIDEFCLHAVELAVSRKAYQQTQQTSRMLLEELYHGPRNWEMLQSKLIQTQTHLTDFRHSDYTRAMLWHHSNRSTEYFSKWIELKQQQQQQQQANHEHEPNGNNKV